MNYEKYYSGVRSKYDQSGFYALRGVDIHSNAGSITSSYAMTKASASLVDKTPTCAATLPNGDSFFATSGSGKIWKCTSTGTVSLVHTNTEGDTRGMGYHNGYLYYASSDKLGRIAEANASSESSWSSETDTWATFTNAASYKPMIVHNLSLFIGDGHYVAAVDEEGTFSANALDLEAHHDITALARWGDFLLIGTYVGSDNHQAGLFVWDTYSSSWTTSDYIDEAGINMFIPADNNLFMQAGTVGNIYYWTGEKAEKFGKLRDGSNSVTTTINPYGSANLNGLPLLATTRGIYSLGKSDVSMPIAQSIEYLPSAGQGLTTAGALLAVGSQVFFGWYDGTDYGIDKISTSKDTGVIETPLAIGKFQEVKVYYESLPTSTSITCKLSKDGGAFASHTLVQDDENERIYKSDTRIDNKSNLQVQISLNPSTTTAPTIYNIELT
jgi:hypothetical protein